MNSKYKKIAIASVFSLTFIGGAVPVNALETKKVLNTNSVYVMLSPKPSDSFLEPPKTIYTAKSRLSPKELKHILHDAGFRGKALKLAWATAMKESTGRPLAHNKNNNTGDNSYGLFQINMIGNLGPARLKQYKLSSNNDLFDPLTNAKIAYHMSNKGKNWSAWHGVTESTKKWLQKYPH